MKVSQSGGFDECRWVYWEFLAKKLSSLISANESLYSFRSKSAIVKRESIEKFIEEIEKAGGKIITTATYTDEKVKEYIFNFNGCLLSFEMDTNLRSSVAAIGLHKRTIDTIRTITLRNLKDISNSKGTVNLIVNGSAGPEIVPANHKINNTFIAGNYSKETIERYNHIRACIESDNPCGRIVVMEGDPGVGKSFLIKALITEMQARFVIVPAHMIQQISGPDLLPLLIEENWEGSTARSPLPIVLILEDADAALAKRKSEGGSSLVSDLLNMGDGILGELCNVRIIATTNTKKVSLDAAITRPGRLCTYMHIDKLDKKQANEVYNRLGGKERTFTSPTTLAEVYRAARPDTWKGVDEKATGGQYL